MKLRFKMQERQSLAEGTVRARGLAGESEADEVTQAQSTSHCTSVARLHVVTVPPIDAVNTCTECKEKIRLYSACSDILQYL